MIDEKVERVIAAARVVFARYGFTRTNMADIAKAAKMSRPALYLVFPSKDKIFAAVIERSYSEMLVAIREGISRFKSPYDKLTFAFDVWCVRPFELVQVSPEAKDLLENGHELSREITANASEQFKTIVAEVVRPITRVPHSPKLKLKPSEISDVLVSALSGFKQSARDIAELKQLIAVLATMVCN